jgi:hypothetical protein
MERCSPSMSNPTHSEPNAADARALPRIHADVVDAIIATKQGRNGDAMKTPHIGAVLILLVLSACSSARPVLYPNAHLQSVGKEAAEDDIGICKELAESSGAEKRTGVRGGRVAVATALGAGTGAASGAVGGALTGAAGRGSMIGAASGAVWGLLTGLFRTVGVSDPSPAYTNFVDRCLQEKGYEVTGWR